MKNNYQVAKFVTKIIVCHTDLVEITINDRPPHCEEFPLTFQIADSFDHRCQTSGWRVILTLHPNRL